jgi:hypothetical protein
MTLGTHWEAESLGRGRVRHVQHVKPIAYRDNHGRIRRIQTAWQDGPETHPHLITSAPFGVSVSNGGEIRYHPTRQLHVGFQIGDPVYRIGGDLRHFDLGTPDRNGNRLDWLTQHLQMRYWHLGHAGKLAMLFRTDAYQNVDNREIAFPISYAGCQRQGRHIVIDGQPLMRLRPFRAYDHDDPEQTAHVPHEWRTVAGQEYIVITLPLAMDAWSKPVLDPTFESQPGSAAGTDAYIHSKNPDTNYGTSQTLLCRDGGAGIFRPLLAFDLSSIPDNALLTTVTLTLAVNNDGGMEATDDVKAYRLKRNWVESQVTWNDYSSGNSWQTAGAAGANDRESSHVGIHENYQTGSSSIDLTFSPTSKADLDLGYGWIIPEAGNNDSVDFCSSDNTTAANRPKLTIEYTEPVGALLTLTGAG